MTIAVCERGDLERAAHAAGRASTLRYSPVFSHLLLAAEPGRLKITGTGSDLTISYGIEAQVDGAGAVGVNARTLGALIAVLPGQPVKLEIGESDLTLRCGRHRATLKGVGASEFPDPPPAGEYLLSVKAEQLHDAIRQVVFAAAPANERPVLAGILLEIREGTLTAVAADGFRLAICKRPVETAAEASLIVPARSLGELVHAGIPPAELIDVVLIQETGAVAFHTSALDLVSQTVDKQMQYPPYDQIVPASLTAEATMPVAQLREMVRRSAVIAKGAFGAVRLELAPEGVRVSASSELGSNSDVAECSVSGSAARAAANATYLLEPLAAMDANAQVTLGVSGETTPIVLRLADGSVTHVVMPMHVPGWE